MKFKLLVASLFLVAGTAQANTISTSVYYDNEPGETVQYVNFNVTDAGFFKILAAEDLLLSNPHAILFSNPLSAGIFIASNDNRNNSLFNFEDDSYIQTALNIGSYVLAISNSFLTVDEAISGYNGDVNFLNDGRINVTIKSLDGTAEFSNPSAVPVPAAAWLLGSALLGFAGFRRKSV
ncbi:MAG: VPLPA-CTERM sorting domain-containing protein [Pseudomonadota bacterium]